MITPMPVTRRYVGDWPRIGIRPDLPEDRLFRPNVWMSLGTADPEGADFRACAVLGPLYGRR